MKKILFVHTFNTPFVLRDRSILEENFQLKDLYIPDQKGLLRKLKAVILILKNIKNQEIVYIWFADFLAYVSVIIAKLLRKKTVVIVGGYELANLPQFQYGALLSKSRTMRVRKVIENATLILPVDESLKADAENLIGHKPNNIITVPTGYDPEKFYPEGDKKKEVLTVAVVREIGKAHLKGLHTFLQTAKELPEISFIIVGLGDRALDWAKENCSPNVTILPVISESELLKLYQSAKVYCQLSYREGLPNALCEAMLCECVPVGTKRNGIPKAIGDTGFYAEYGDVDSTKTSIIKALESNNGSEARTRILQLFPRQRRKQELLKILGELS